MNFNNLMQKAFPKTLWKKEKLLVADKFILWPSATECRVLPVKLVVFPLDFRKVWHNLHPTRFYQFFHLLNDTKMLPDLGFYF